ncbi:PE family protein [Mycobacterium simiae]|uniref:PE family protein n=1 Tax=Mycobacterium simiae TaxID=1784 RepID=A0A5B1BFN2_MYCSI|nr:PE family protein [Mycobacterium simiae]KAA1246084.1 PE family protein [Mycobacterium simiae]
MSFVLAAPEVITATSANLAGIGSALQEAAAAAAGPTTGIAAAAADEVSIAVSQLFGTYGQEFQALNAQLVAFHDEFVRLLNGGAAAYLTAEAANAGQMLAKAVEAPRTNSGAASPLFDQIVASVPGLQGLEAGVLPTLVAPRAAAAAPGGAYQQLFANTATNLQALTSDWAAHPFPLLSKIMANQEIYLAQTAIAAGSAIQNLPAELANLPVAVPAALRELLAFNPGLHVQQFITTQTGFAQTIGTELNDATNEITAGLPRYEAELRVAYRHLEAGEYTDAAVDLAKAHANLFVTGAEANNVRVTIDGLSVRISTNVTLRGPLEHLFTIAGVPGQEAQYLTDLMPPGSIPRQMSQNFTNVLNTLSTPGISGSIAVHLLPVGAEFSAFFGLPLALGYAAAGPPVVTFHALATSATAIEHAMATGNGLATLGALIDAPAVVANGFLNGREIMDLTIPVSTGLPSPLPTTVSIVLHMPFDGILVPPHPVTATIDVPGFPLPGFPVDLTIGGTPFSGMVPLLVNYLPQELAKAITPAA